MKSRWIDLTHSISPDTMPYPGDPCLILEKNEKKGKDDFVLSRVTTGMHLGTHVDSFSHLIKNGADIVSLPPDRFYGKAALVRVKQVGGLIKTQDVIYEWEKLSDKPEILLLETGQANKFGKKEYYTGCPGFEPGFAKVLASFKVRLFGVDLPTVKYGVNGNAAMHRDLFENEILIVESLANLDKLPVYFDFFALPLKIEGAEASLVRAMALAD
ncbi:MAG TPA: cyclase family protein [Bacillota bacterium]|nr:cyclase family protein [Bacillota bacterium]HPF42241.1 cyclase family protein [Bacillota bacterium]HPJ85737.1 cyclase family protein [Bacillota bacterium]HPQ61626.1 cyclase family protein [Bacillota bacterium]HRX91533.1 cyclase family protein [Candidatus Izemoplasmatales bacterium]